MSIQPEEYQPGTKSGSQIEAKDAAEILGDDQKKESEKKEN